MSGIADDIKRLFNYKYKKRDDEFSDQFSRIFMAKVMIVAAFLTSLEWYSDEINCLVPKLAGEGIEDFSGKACWVNGFYVYDELRSSKGCRGYFGLPMSSQHNGTINHEHAQCETCTVQSNSMDCRPMTKRFYIQYQWYPFFLAALAMLYYAPYFLFHIANEDLKSLKVEIKKLEPDIKQIVETFFNTSDQALMKSQKRNIMLNVLIKLGYVLANVFVFVLCDVTLNGDFKGFGLKWISWTQIPEHDNYVEQRSFVDASDLLLPTFGFCDVLEQGLDIKLSLINEHRLVCEISQHILYQYILMALWFLMVLGIAVSVLGFVVMLISYVSRGSTLSKQEGHAELVYKRITLRQSEYLGFVRKKNEVFYGEIIEYLYNQYEADYKKTLL